MNTTELLQDIKRAVTVPDYQKRYDNDDILRFATINLNSKILQLLLEVDEEYNVKSVEIDHLATDSYVEIPSYFVGQQLRAVMYKQQGDESFYNLVRYELRERFTSLMTPSTPKGFSFEDDRLYLHPKPSQPGTVLFFYRKKHPKLVPVTRTATVLSASGNNITLTANPPQNFVVGSNIDANKGKANYQNKVMNEVVTNIVGPVLTMANPVTDWNLQPGDEIALHNETALVQLADELHECLVWAVCVDIVKGLNIPDHISVAEGEYNLRAQSALQILRPRSQDSLATIVQYNGVLSRPFKRFPSVSI